MGNNISTFLTDTNFRFGRLLGCIPKGNRIGNSTKVERWQNQLLVYATIATQSTLSYISNLCFHIVPRAFY